MIEEVAKKIKLLDGRICTICIPYGYHMSRAVQAQRLNPEFDVVLFLMREVCTIENKKQDIDVFKNMMIDDYSKIMILLGELCETIMT